MAQSSLAPYMKRAAPRKHNEAPAKTPRATPPAQGQSIKDEPSTPTATQPAAPAAPGPLEPPPGTTGQQAVLQAAAASPAEGFSSKEYAAQWAKFQRSMHNTAAGKTARSEKCPDAIMLQMTDMDSQRQWFHTWVEQGSSWANVVAWQTVRKRQTNSAESLYGWMTAAQVEDLYKDPSVAAAICAKCEKDPNLWRPHPDVPELKEAMQFWVSKVSQNKQTTQHVNEKGLQFEMSGLDEATAGQVANKMLIDGPGHGGNSSGSGGFQNHGINEEAATAKAEQELKRKGEVAAAKAKQAAERAAAKRAEAETPAGKAQKWLGGVAGELEQVVRLVEQCHSKNSSIAPDVRGVYGKRFVDHEHQLRALRDAIEQAMVGKDGAELEITLSQAAECVLNIRADIKVFTTLTKLAGK